jgi:dynein heavy chain 2
VQALVSSWLAHQSEKLRPKLGAWIEALFFRALDWLATQQPVVATTRVGLVRTALSHLSSDTVADKGAFVCGLVRGGGANLSPDARAEFARQVFAWAGESSPDPLNAIWNPNAGAYALLQPAESDARIDAERLSPLDPPIVPTPDLLRTAHTIEPWLRRGEPLVVVGPEGCGKSMAVRFALRKMKGVSVATVHCNAQTSAAHVIQKLKDACAVFTTSAGRALRPKEGEALVLFLKDLNLPRPDKYDTIQLVAFLQQLVTYGGFFDSSLEWMGVEKVQIVATMCPPSTMGRHDTLHRQRAPPGHELQRSHAAADYLRSAAQCGTACRGRRPQQRCAVARAR